MSSLNKDWATGKLSSKKVLECARGASSHGASGMQSFDSSRRAQCLLTNVFGIPAGAPDLTWLEIPTRENSKPLHPFLLPHEFFSSYFHNRHNSCCPTQRSPRRHGSRSSLLACAATLARSLTRTVCARSAGTPVFTVFRKSEIVDGTLNAVFEMLAWSVKALLKGTFPQENWHGCADGRWELPGGWRGALCQIRGDWAFYTQIFKFPQWNGAQRVCFLCRGSSTIAEVFWTNSGPDASWRQTWCTHEAYLDLLCGAGFAIPVLLVAFIGFRLECVTVDVRQMVDQGVASHTHAVANVFWLCAVRRKSFGEGTQDTSMNLLFTHMQNWYKSHKLCSKWQGKFTVDRVRTSGGWSKLTRRAASTRHLAHFALHLAQTFGTSEDRRVLAVCRLLCEFYGIVSSESMCLTASVKEKLPVVGRNLAIICSALAEPALASHTRMWKMHPKAHFFVHMCEWQAVEVGNPRFYWTYSDEDLVGLLVEVAQSCHPKTLAASALLAWMHVYCE